MGINIDVKNGSIALRVFAHKGNWSLNVQSYTRSSCKHSHLYCLGVFFLLGCLRKCYYLALYLFLHQVQICSKKARFFFPQQILNNYVQFEVYSGLSQVASLKMSQSRVSDGEWHHLLIELKSAKDGKDLKYLAVMSLDYGMYQVRQHHNFATEHCTNAFRRK